MDYKEGAGAPESQKRAVFSVAGGGMMFILTVLVTIRTGVMMASDFPSSLISSIFPVLITIGMWILWASARNKNTNPIGVRFIRIPFLIQFIVSIICYVFLTAFLIFAIVCAESGSDLTSAIVTLVIFAVCCILNILYFASINGCLKDGTEIMKDRFSRRRAPGKFAAVITFINALAEAVPVIVIGVLLVTNSSLLGEMVQFLSGAFTKLNIPEAATQMSSYIATLAASASGVLLIISGVLSFMYQGFAGLLMLRYIHKRNA